MMRFFPTLWMFLLRRRGAPPADRTYVVHNGDPVTHLGQRVYVNP